VFIVEDTCSRGGKEARISLYMVSHSNGICFLLLVGMVDIITIKPVIMSVHHSVKSQNLCLIAHLCCEIWFMGSTFVQFPADERSREPHVASGSELNDSCSSLGQ
jgi:hypothetical protein